MAEYIERAAAVKVVLRERKPTNSVAQNRMLSIIQHDLLTMRAADVAPVVHGRWISVAGKRDRICSRCLHNEPYKNADDNAEVFEFCPHCGAKMDGGDSNAFPEVVTRCKDCKHRWEDIGGLCCGYGPLVDCIVPEDFFCAYGKPKEV